MLGADKLSHNLSAVRTGPVFDEVDRLPHSERQLAIRDRDLERGCGQHRLDVCRHVVGTFRAVGPSGIRGCEPIQHGYQIVEH